MVRNLFFLGIILAASGLLSPPLALACGIAYGLLATHEYHADARRLSKFLLQASVVCLGFGMNLGEVIRVGRSGFLYTAVGITFALLLGAALAWLLRVAKIQGFLISAGTAICGGSAIAALAPVTEASEEALAVSMGTVFVLNSVALFIFPVIGHALHLTQTQFGLWSALAIHDTSSVVGAAAHYGAVALAIATTVKLARALWIIPVSLGAAVVRRSHARIHIPWFILFFCLAAVANTFLLWMHPESQALVHLGRMGLAVTLFLIGTGITRATLRQVGVRPLLQGILLWAVVGSASLFLILRGWIHL
ncbi:MAG TPA: putative sulfate exporter family transporter [Acidobacteriaceae bacterium]|nr:putative sulfate exporter family transporter [Acidobacteriaceae bacterium]